MRMHYYAWTGVLLLMVSGCGSIGSDPPASILEKAQEQIPLETHTISTTPGEAPRVVPVRAAEPGSPRILLRSERPLEEEAADALARIGVPAVPQAIALLNDRRPAARIRAAKILAQIGPDAHAAVPMLIDRLQDEDEGVRKAAAHALGQMGPAAEQAVPALLRAAAGTNP